MNQLPIFTAEFSTRICLTLVHSLWQVALLALLSWIIERLVSRRFPEVGYIVSSLALLTALILLPVTFHALKVAKPIVSQTLPVQNTTEIKLRPEESHASNTHDISIVTVPDVAHFPDHSEAVTLEVQEQAQSDLTAKPQAASFDWSRLTPWVVGIYLLGVSWMLFRLVNSIRHASRLAKSGKPVISGPVFETLQRLGKQWSMKVLPRLSVAKECVMPKVIGVMKPTILLPASALTGLSEAELEIILLHELAHVRRHDLWMNLFQRLAEVVLFFNPALWWLSHRISTQREYCCDEMACREMANMNKDHSHIPRTQYAFTLLRIVEMMQGQPPSESLTTLAMSNRAPSELRRRVGRLFGESVHQSVSPSRGGVLFVVAGVFLMVCTALWSAPQELEKSEDALPENNNAALVKQLKQECKQVTDRYTGDHRDGHGKLIRLDLFDASQSAVNTVSQIKGLRELEFVASDLRDADLDAIQKLTSLEKLVIMNCQFHPQQMSAFETLTNLKHLEVIFTVFRESESWRLEQLGLLSEEEQQLSQRLKSDFEIGDHVIQAALLTDRAMPALENLTQLKTLKLINTFVSPNGLQHLAPLTQLEHLQFGIVGHTAESLTPLFGMKQLKSLNRFNADDAIVEQLSKVTSLEELNIWAGGVTDMGATYLAKLSKLRELRINGNQLTEVGLQKLLTLPNLQELDVRGAVISPEANKQIQIPERLQLRGVYTVAWDEVLSKSQNPDGKDLVETRFTGTIVDESGQPLKQEGILTYDAEYDEHRSASGNAGEFTDRFTFLLPPGKTYLTHYVKGYAPTDVGPFTGEMGQEISNIKIVMKRGVEQRIRVVNDDGEPIANATVVSHPEFHGSADGFIYPKTTDQNGEYLYEHLAETRYAFNVTASGYEPLRTEPLDLKPGEVLTLTMTKSQPTTGVVLNPDGTPAANAKLRAQWESGERTVSFSDSDPGGWWGKVFATTNERGEFTLNQLTSDAQYMFIIQTEDGNRLIYRDLKAGQQDVKIQMPKRADLKIHINGDITPLRNYQRKYFVDMRQRVKTKTSERGTHGDLFGQKIELTPTKTRATATFHGLAIDPEATEPQTVEVYFSYDTSTKQIVEINTDGDTVVEFDLRPADVSTEEEKIQIDSPTSQLRMKLQDSQLLKTDLRITNIEEFDDDIVSVKPENPRLIRVKAQAVGATSIKILDENGTEFTLEVIVESDQEPESFGRKVIDIGIGLNGYPKDYLFLDGRPMHEDLKMFPLHEWLTKLGYSPEDTLIRIRAHPEATHGTVVKLLDGLQKHQWQHFSLNQMLVPEYDDQQLIGVWQPTVCEFSGTHSPIKTDLKQKWIFGQQTATVIYADGSRESFNYRIKPSGNKLLLSLKWTEGKARAGYPAIGLIEVGQKKMKLGFLINSENRPTELTREAVLGMSRGGQYVELKRVATKLPPKEKLAGNWTGERDGIKIRKFQIEQDGAIHWKLSTGKAGIGVSMDKTPRNEVNGFMRLTASLGNGPLITGILSDGPGDTLILDVLPSLHYEHSYKYRAMPGIVLTKQDEVAVNDGENPEEKTTSKISSIPKVKPFHFQFTGGAEKKPLSNLTVHVFPKTSGLAPSVATAKTDEEGLARVNVPLEQMGSHMMVEVTSAVELPYKAKWKALPKPAKSDSLTSVNFPKTVTAIFRAIDAETGKGVPGVMLTREDAGGEVWGVDPLTSINISPKRLREKDPCVTDKNGQIKCRIEATDIWSYEIFKLPEGYQEVERDFVRFRVKPGGEVQHTFKLKRTQLAHASEESDELRVWKTQLINGTNDQPLAGIKVEVNGAVAGEKGPQLMTLVSDDNGMIEFPLRNGTATTVNVLTPGWFQIGLGFIGQMVGLGVKSDAGVEGELTGPIKLWPGQQVTGRFVYPDQTPASGVLIHIGAYVTNFSRYGIKNRIWRSFDHGDWPNWSRRIVTAADGSFTTTVPPEDVRLWLRVGTSPMGFGAITLDGLDPDGNGKALASCVPFELQIGGARGSHTNIASSNFEQDEGSLYLGDLQLKSGVVAKGRVLDVEGNGLENVYLTTAGAHGPHSGRSCVSGKNGEFEFLPIEPGGLTIRPDARLRDAEGKVISRDVQAVFVDESFSIPDSDKPVEITVNAVPTHEWMFEWIDRRKEKGPVSFYGRFILNGYYPSEEGQTFWHGETHLVERDGKQYLVVKAPRKLYNAAINLPKDSIVTATYKDDRGKIQGPGRVELGSVINSLQRVIYGDEPIVNQ